MPCLPQAVHQVKQICNRNICLWVTTVSAFSGTIDLPGSCPTPVRKAQASVTCKTVGVACSPLGPGDCVLSTKRCPKGTSPLKCTRASKWGGWWLQKWNHTFSNKGYLNWGLNAYSHLHPETYSEAFQSWSSKKDQKSNKHTCWPAWSEPCTCSVDFWPWVTRESSQ